jgi:hypothetical protein
LYFTPFPPFLVGYRVEGAGQLRKDSEQGFKDEGVERSDPQGDGVLFYGPDNPQRQGEENAGQHATECLHWITPPSSGGSAVVVSRLEGLSFGFRFLGISIPSFAAHFRP